MSTTKQIILKSGANVVHRNQELDLLSEDIVGLGSTDDSTGTITNGVTTIYAYIDSNSNTYSTGNVSLTIEFDAMVSSVSIQAFNEFRNHLTGLLGKEEVLLIDSAAGIPPGIQDGSGMERFAVCLLSRMFNGNFGNAKQVFNATKCASPNWKCNDVLHAIRELKPQVLHFSGKLHIEGPEDVPQQMVASIPVSMIEFSSGYTVPFTGYAGPIVCQSLSSSSATNAVHMRKPIRIVLEAGQLLSCLSIDRQIDGNLGAKTI